MTTTPTAHEALDTVERTMDLMHRILTDVLDTLIKLDAAGHLSPVAHDEITKMVDRAREAMS